MKSLFAVFLVGVALAGCVAATAPTTPEDCKKQYDTARLISTSSAGSGNLLVDVIGAGLSGGVNKDRYESCLAAVSRTGVFAYAAPSAKAQGAAFSHSVPLAQVPVAGLPLATSTSGARPRCGMRMVGGDGYVCVPN